MNSYILSIPIGAIRVFDDGNRGRIDPAPPLEITVEAPSATEACLVLSAALAKLAGAEVWQPYCAAKSAEFFAAKSGAPQGEST